MDSASSPPLKTETSPAAPSLDSSSNSMGNGESALRAEEIVESLGAALASLETVIYGKNHQIRLALTCLIAGGHLLIEDLPGLGKTTLAHALATVLGLNYRRVQFTSDLLPADLTGFSMWDKNAEEFQFRRGPLFTQVLLADEINRSSPKAQSALLESMEEGQVSVDGQTYPLPKPFFVIATQNPFSLEGTFPLPESQLDRFLMRLTLGYPDAQSERQLLNGIDPRSQIGELAQLANPESLVWLRSNLKQIRVPDISLSYTMRLLEATRERTDFVHGISPRGGMALLQAARGWAALDGRDYVTPDDIQVVVGPVFGHRLVSRAEGKSLSLDDVERWLQTVDLLQE